MVCEYHSILVESMDGTHVLGLHVERMDKYGRSKRC